MLSLPSTFWRGGRPGVGPGNTLSRNSPRDVHGEEVPEEIIDGPPSPKKQGCTPITMAASTGRRISRPLSNRAVASGSTSTQAQVAKVPRVPSKAKVNPSWASQQRRASTGAGSSCEGLPTDDTRNVKRSCSARASAAADVVTDAAVAACIAPSRGADGDAILQVLTQYAQQLQGAGARQEGSKLQHAVATLSKACADEGFNLDGMVDFLLRGTPEPPPAAAAEPAEPTAQSQRPINRRLPRGLLGGAFKQPSTSANDNQIVMRLLNPHDRSCKSIALNRIELYDAAEQQCALHSECACWVTGGGWDLHILPSSQRFLEVQRSDLVCMAVQRLQKVLP
jgi:hypothetical protein